MSTLAPPVPQRPTTVVLAVCFTAVNAAAFVVRLVVRYAQPPPHPLWAEIVWTIAFTVLGAFWVYGLWRSHNWVRWITIAYGVGNLLAVPRASTLFYGAAIAVFWVEVSFSAAAAALLLLPPAWKWYTNSSVRSNQRWSGP
jgi:hypothetical protein